MGRELNLSLDWGSSLFIHTLYVFSQEISNTNFWDWTLVSRAIGEHSNRLANGPVQRKPKTIH